MYCMLLCSHLIIVLGSYMYFFTCFNTQTPRYTYGLSLLTLFLCSELDLTDFFVNVKCAVTMTKSLRQFTRFI